MGKKQACELHSYSQKPHPYRGQKRKEHLLAASLFPPNFGEALVLVFLHIICFGSVVWARSCAKINTRDVWVLFPEISHVLKHFVQTRVETSIISAVLVITKNLGSRKRTSIQEPFDICCVQVVLFYNTFICVPHICIRCVFW